MAKYATAALLALLLAPASMACTSPAIGTLEDLMTQTTWTDETGSYFTRREATVRIELPELATAGYGCLRWNVRIILPTGFALRPDSEGNAGASSFADLTPSQSATFEIALPQRHGNWHHEYARGWLRVQVRNPLADAGVFLARREGSPVWLFPVRFKVSGN